MKKKKTTVSPELSSKKRLLFFLIMLATPFLLLFLLEIGLRLFTHGVDLSLFTTENIAGRTLHVMNPDVKTRYFPSVPFNPSTSPDYFETPKPKGTYRIFCLGGSTTVGYPYWYNGAFASFLRDRLRATFPERNIEIINLGMTATNSFSVNDMARDLADVEPDLLLVYDGHNEFYGAMGVASHESIARSRWLTRAYLRLIHFRTFRLLQRAMASIKGLFGGQSEQTAGSTMMEKLARGQVIALGSDLYNDGLSTYKDNLDELASIAADLNVPVLLGSQVSNLRDLPPFISEDPASQAGFSNHSEFLIKYDLGVRYRAKAQIDSALAAFKAASILDTMRADAHYAIAQCLDSLGRYAGANIEYVRARDLDMLRFRMSSDFNAAMKQASVRNKMIFVDMERAFRSHSTDSLIGKELIVEHLHPNSKGEFILAKEYARAMRDNSLFAEEGQWQARDTISDELLWQNRCLTNIDELTAQRRTEILTSGWPFVSQVPIVDAVAANDTLGQIVEHVVRGQWSWMKAHDAAAEYYIGRQEWNKAADEYRTLTNQLPLIDVQPYLKLARIDLSLNNLKGAKKALIGSLNVQPTLLAYRALGDICMQDSAAREAIFYYEKALAFSPSPRDKVENGYMLAVAYVQAKLMQPATTTLLNVLALKPDYQPAVTLLARLNGR